MKRYKIRFNLGAGENYMKWQIEDRHNKTVEYHEPLDCSLQMQGTKLVNQQATANKIFNGANKSVCAWIEADGCVITTTPTITEIYVAITYNPKVTPHWMSEGEIVDKGKYKRLVTVGRGIYWP